MSHYNEYIFKIGNGNQVIPEKGLASIQREQLLLPIEVIFVNVDVDQASGNGPTYMIRNVKSKESEYHTYERNSTRSNHMKLHDYVDKCNRE